MSKVINGIPNPKKGHEAHSSNRKFGMGDHYGSGYRNPIGRMRYNSYPGMVPVNKKQMGTPPRSVA